MKIIAVMGTYRKNGTGAGHVAKIASAFESIPGVEFDTIWLGDHDIMLCRGCMVCYDRGEGSCPLKDGYLDAIRKLNEADAAIFYSPTYTLSISGMMKTFFDRSSFVLHRPYFKGRHAIVLTSVESYGEKTALKTLKTIVSMMGFAVDEQIAVVNARYTQQPKYCVRIDSSIEQAAIKLVERTASGKKIKPTFFELITFNFQKSAFGADTEGCRSDKQFWKTAGWAHPDADFYCPARVSRLKSKLAKVITRFVKSSGLLPG
jgi:multimeric flavodoxin WrbA